MRALLSKAAGTLALLSLLTVSTMAWAGTHYEVKGEATVDVMPDKASIFALIRGESSDAAGAMARFKAVRADIVSKLREAGVPAESLDFIEEAVPPIPVRNQTGTTNYVTMQPMLVSVHDFSLLPKLTRIVTESGNKDWSVTYDFGDPTKPLKLAGAAALANATRKAEQYAKSRGLTGARLLAGANARTCFPHAEGDPAYCQTAGEKPAEPEIVVTARKREGPRTDFSVPVPKPQTFTATVDATFELQ